MHYDDIEAPKIGDGVEGRIREKKAAEDRETPLTRHERQLLKDAHAVEQLKLVRLSQEMVSNEKEQSTRRLALLQFEVEEMEHRRERAKESLSLQKKSYALALRQEVSQRELTNTIVNLHLFHVVCVSLAIIAVAFIIRGTS